MSTRCFIGIYDSDKDKVKYIYSHWDGYISHVGIYLYYAYQDVEKIKKLINLGDISSLGYNVEAPRKFRDSKDVCDLSLVMGCHVKTSFTVSYKRDRGEKNVNATMTNLAGFTDLDERFLYLYDLKEKKWLVQTADTKFKKKGFYDLGKMIENEKYYKASGEDYESWDTIHECAEDFKADIACGPGRTIIDQFNERLIECNRTDIAQFFEFGYTVDKKTGKRMYALYKKPEQGKKNRKLYASNPIIGDLFLLLKEQYGIFVY